MSTKLSGYVLLAALLAVAAACTTTVRAAGNQPSDGQSTAPGADSARIHVPHAAAAERLAGDWANLGRYAAANRGIARPARGEDRVVFMGNSITESWAPYFASMFPGKPYIGRGISGQTTPQMLLRFRQDVIALEPKVVVILAGTNDIAGNTGPATLEMIQDNLASMVDLAQANGIRVVLASVLPAYRYRWRPDLRPAETIAALNRWIKRYALDNGVVYLDYHAAMADERLGLRSELSADGVHPNEAGYRLMAPLTVKAIGAALALPAVDSGPKRHAR